MSKLQGSSSRSRGLHMDKRSLRRPHKCHYGRALRAPMAAIRTGELLPAFAHSSVFLTSSYELGMDDGRLRQQLGYKVTCHEVHRIFRLPNTTAKKSAQCQNLNVTAGLQFINRQPVQDGVRLQTARRVSLHRRRLRPAGRRAPSATPRRRSPRPSPPASSPGSAGSRSARARRR